MRRLPPIFSLGVVALTLAACGELPDFRVPGSPTPAAVSAPPPAATLPPQTGAGAAETACTAAGQERGFTVQGVVGSTDVAGADGQPASRDVMLRVARGQQVFDLRCNYHYASSQARVMAL